MRTALFLLVPLLVGCEPGTPAATSADTEADRLLAAVTPGAVDAAFDALASRTAQADLTVTESEGAGTRVGETTVRLLLTPGDPRVLDRSGAGTLADTSNVPPRLRNPLDTALPDDPPYVDPASRDQYRRAIVGDTVVAGRRLRVVEAVLADAEAEQGVRRVRAAVDPETGRAVTVVVDRAAASAVYDEQSRVRVELAPAEAGVWLPHIVETDAQTDVPLAPVRRIRTLWIVRLDAAP